MIIGLSIYVGEYEKLLDDTPATRDDKYSFSFGIGWVAAILYVLSAATFGVGVKFVRDEIKEMIYVLKDTVNIKDYELNIRLCCPLISKFAIQN